MAPIGGGPPIGSTNSFTGTAQALEIIGEHCMAYSGVVNDAGGSSSAASTMFDFTSGNYYCVVTLDILTDSKAGENNFVELFFNGVTVYKGVWDEVPAFITSPLVRLIIPPYTEVVFKWGNSSNKNATAILSGRIYRD
tara:strand:- start:190 stop:603 length:414 start_codon:yes stop_codon:yes gene_type:complete